jgi:hypothetical protein
MYKKILENFGKLKDKSISDLYITLNRKLIVMFYKVFSLYPTSRPFLSADTFRKLASVVYRGEKLNLTKPEIIYLQSKYLKKFMKSAKKIKQNFILISHDGDDLVDLSYKHLANNPFLIRWYAANSILKHTKVIPIPLGLQNRRLHLFGVISDFIKLRKKNQKKLPRILSCFDIRTNPIVRKPVLDILKRLKTVNEFKGTATVYRQQLNKYMFFASPRGSGIDTYRTWEGIYLNAIPIVVEKKFHEQFKKIPFLIIKDWKELESYSASDLNSIYQNKIKKLKENKYIWYDYWHKDIQKNIQKLFKENLKDYKIRKS